MNQPYTWTLNLQHFAEEGEAQPVDAGMGDVAAPQETFEEPAVTEDADVNGDEPAGMESDTPDAEPVDQRKYKQTPEQDRAFAEMRREAEAARKQKQQMDAMIAEQYGHMGIANFEQYQEALAKQKAEEERQRYRDAGLPDDVIDKLSKVDQILKQSEQQQLEAMLTSQYNDLAKEYADLVKSPEDIQPEVWQKFNSGKNGLTLSEAYFLVNRQTIMNKQTAATRQAAINNVNSKNHIRPNGGAGGSDIDTTVIPPETLAAYRSMFPKMTDKQFLEHYKRSQGG